MLHQRDNHLSLLGYSEAVLWIVEPLFVCVEVCLSFLRFFVAVSFRRVRTTVSLADPLTSDRELTPGAGEDFADVDFVVIGSPVFVIHPPVSIVLELISKFVS